MLLLRPIRAVPDRLPGGGVRPAAGRGSLAGASGGDRAQPDCGGQRMCFVVFSKVRWFSRI